jgi:hypothetical protein
MIKPAFYLKIDNHHLRERFAFVVRAMSTDETRIAIHRIMIEEDEPWDNGNTNPTLSGGKRIVATDGRRLHAVRLDAADAELFPGYGVYDVKRCPSGWVFIPEHEQTFPQYKCVIPKETRTTQTHKVTSPKRDRESFVFNVYSKTRRVFNLEYMTAGYQNGDWYFKTDGEQTDILHVLNADNGDFMIVMCIRKD